MIFNMCFVIILLPLDEWMKYLCPLKGESLAVWTIIQVLLPSVDLSIFLHGQLQEELLADLGHFLLLSYSRNKIYTCITNPIPMQLINLNIR